MSCSSEMSPTISSRMSSSVTSPSTSPYSSTTSAKWRLAPAERLELLGQRADVGHEPGRQRDRHDVDLRRGRRSAFLSARSRSLACRMPTMFSGLVAPQRHAGVPAPRARRCTISLGRIVGVDHDHLGAVDHDVGDRQVAQVEQAADHVAVVLLDAALAVQQVDRAAQLLVRRQDRLRPRRRGCRPAAGSGAPAIRSRSAPARAGARRAPSAAPPAARCGRAR